MVYCDRVWSPCVLVAERREKMLNEIKKNSKYVSVLDIQVQAGLVQAVVMSSSIYGVSISITKMIQDKWKELVKSCSGQIDSLVELLQGKFSKAIMTIMTEKYQGLFPKPQEIKFNCSCPDCAGMCKHVAATMYGIGACLDNNSKLLFTLRQVDHLDLISKAISIDVLAGLRLPMQLLLRKIASLFGINITEDATIAEAVVNRALKTKNC